jgi:Ni,Fe-hydrogenase III small subunit
MWQPILERIRQKHRTFDYPRLAPVMSARFHGMPVLCTETVADTEGPLPCCPTGALTVGRDLRLRLDMGKCLFCGECERALGSNAVKFSNEHRLAAKRREDLEITNAERALADALSEESASLFGHSLKLRQVSAGGCNACEADTNVLNTLVFDLGRFGIQFVASPRHADGLLVTGPVTKNMELALRKTYDAVPFPKIVIAVGACAISGGIYAGHNEVNCGVSDVLPVDLFIPGCPPHPWTILDGLLSMLGRVKRERSQTSEMEGRKRSQ